MAMRLLEHEVSFNELEAPGENHNEGAGHISKAVISSSLGHVMERRGNVLDGNEMEQMIDFCLTTVSEDFNGQDQVLDEGGFTSFLNEACDGLNTFFEDVKESLGCTKEDKDDNSTQVDLDKFASACSSAEPISFDALVKLFDKDRRVGLMERFFMPQKFRQSIRKAKRKAELEDEQVQPFKRQGSICTDLTSMKEKVDSIHERLSVHMVERQEMMSNVERLTAKADSFTRRMREHQDRVDAEQKASSERIQQLVEQVTDIQQQLAKSGDERKAVQDKASMSSLLRGTAQTLQLASKVQTLQAELANLGHSLEEQQVRNKLEQNSVQEEVEKLNAHVLRLQLSSRTLSDGWPIADTASASERPIGKDRTKLQAATVTVPGAGGQQYAVTERVPREQIRSKRNDQSTEDVPKMQDAGLVSLRGSADSPLKPLCSSEDMMADLQIRACSIHDFIDARMREITRELKVQVQMHLQAVCSEFQSLPRTSTKKEESPADWLFAP